MQPAKDRGTPNYTVLKHTELQGEIERCITIAEDYNMPPLRN